MDTDYTNSMEGNYTYVDDAPHRPGIIYRLFLLIELAVYIAFALAWMVVRIGLALVCWILAIFLPSFARMWNDWTDMLILSDLEDAAAGNVRETRHEKRARRWAAWKARWNGDTYAA